MANLLFANPSLWVDGNGYSPPAAWNSTGGYYEFFANSSPGSAVLTYTGAIAVGDTVNSPVSWSGGAAGGFNHVVQLHSTGLGFFAQVRDGGLGAGSGTLAYTFAATDSGLTLAADPGSLYDGTIILGTVPAPVLPIQGFIFAAGDGLSADAGPGVLTTMSPPVLTGKLSVPASYARTATGLAAVFYGVGPVLTLPLPEDSAGLYDSTPKQQYRWKSKKFVMPAMATMGAAKVVHDCNGNGVRFRLYVDCCCVFERQVRGCVPFRLPPQIRGMTFEIELIGCARVTEVIVAPTMREIAGE